MIETIIALTVITFAILGPVSLTIFSLKSANVSKDQIIASFLAKDAMEYIKNWRDDNYLQKKSNWLAGLGGGCLNASGCYIDTTLPYDDNQAIKNCPGGGGCPNIKYNALTIEYGYDSGWVDDIFVRTVKISNTTPDEAEVSIIVSWDDKFGSHSFILQDNLFNWHP